MSPWTTGKKKKSQETTYEDLTDHATSIAGQQLECTARLHNDFQGATEHSELRTRPVFEIDRTEGEYHLKILHDPVEAEVEYVLLKLLSLRELTTV